MLSSTRIRQHWWRMIWEVEAGEDGLVSGDELTRAISELMDSQKGSAKDKCKAMRPTLTATIDDG